MRFLTTMPLSQSYNPAEHEDDIYKKWENSGAFNPDNLETQNNAQNYSIMMPPPNVTGVLHLGHAWENTLLDIPARFQRMRGKRVLLLPGTDHAAVATQARVEKNLIESGKYKNPREELGREKLLEIIREFAENSKKIILSQIKKMGTSCDWSRLAYTFDEPRGHAVNEVFARMYNDGLVYRGWKTVNWSVKGQSTCSDDELIYIERPAKLYTFKYSIDFPIAISTTRPETKLGDTAVAVHPNDNRYKQYIGQIFTVDVGAAKPLSIKIISSEHVDPSFGTGALGVTPAHSQVDFEMYERQKSHNNPIEIIEVIGKDGRMTESAGKDYIGLTVCKAREKFVAWLGINGLISNVEDIKQSVGTSDRFGDIIEVIPMTQWWIDVNKKIIKYNKSLKDLMREAVTTGLNNDANKKININPERFQKTYLHWIDNLKDWCISRQVWWGHRIPAWHNKNTGNLFVGKSAPGPDGWEQDPDTLDTWFSSGLWTFSTLKWPNDTDDFKNFHPSSWMQMGYEILFFWMARMVLFSSYILNDIPFKNVYIHGILRDKNGQKFSKSLKNGIDPIEIINEYGTDALRLSLVAGTTPGNDARFYREKVDSMKHFINKLWNIARFIQNYFPELSFSPEEKKQYTMADLWIMTRLDGLIKTTTEDLENYNFSQAEENLRQFIWYDFADWYLEISKFENNKNSKKTILNIILYHILLMTHPFAPFVTEAIWESLRKKGMVITQEWPQSLDIGSFKEANDFKDIMNIISNIRNVRSLYRVAPNIKIDCLIYTKNKLKIIESQSMLITNLRTGINKLTIYESGSKPEHTIFIGCGDVEIYLSVPNLDIEKEKSRLSASSVDLKKRIDALEQRLNAPEFSQKAPAKIIEQEKERLANLQNEQANILKQIKNLI